MRRTLSTAALAVFVILTNAAVAMAASSGNGSGGSEKCATDTNHDPTQIGHNLQCIAQPNAKGFWWCGLIGGLLVMVFSRKASRAAGGLAVLVVSGIAIWNPVGVGAMMSNLAGKLI
jgi:hypothetical protein